MFVWVLRDKGSEWRAATSLQLTGAVQFRPLVEAVCEPMLPRPNAKSKTPQETMIALGRKLGSLATSQPVWIDLGNLRHMFESRDVARLADILRTALGPGTSVVTPVIRTSAEQAEIDTAISWAQDTGSGLCIRIDGLTNMSEKAKVAADLAMASELPDRMIDLIADAQDLPRVVTHEMLADAFPLSQSGRHWVLIAGSFPDAITHLRPDEYEHFIERSEWTTYEEEMEHKAQWRQPHYGDYATQPALYAPSPPFQPSPSVRYTLGNQFVILRGRGGKESDFGQYIGHARFLQGQQYFGEVCRGEAEEYVRRIATGTRGTGNATTWRIASLQRHVAVASAQVEALVRAVGSR